MRWRARRRRRSNAPWGSSEAEVRQARANGTRRRRARSRRTAGHGTPRTMGKVGGSGVLLGRLDALVVKQSQRDRSISRASLRGLYLAWMPRTNQLAIVRRVGGAANPSVLDPKARDIFQRFHQTKPKRAVTYEWPTAKRLRTIGLLRSLTYVVPDEVSSPGKRGFRWVHAFGDHGERGHGEHTGTPTYPDRLMPALCEDQDGNLHIVRRPGNKYDVTEWIYW